MKCICGAKIPDRAEQYPMEPRKVTKGDTVTWETHIVKCEAAIDGFGSEHPLSTGWNFVEQAKARDGQPYRSRRGER